MCVCVHVESSNWHNVCSVVLLAYLDRQTKISFQVHYTRYTIPPTRRGITINYTVSNLEPWAAGYLAIRHPSSVGHHRAVHL